MSAAQNEFIELMRDKSHRRRHPEDDDDDDAHSFLNISDDDFDDSPPSPAPEALAPRPSMSIPTRRYGANTGPKGVISDAQNFRDSRRSQRSSMTSTRPAKQSSRSSSRQVPESTIDEDDDDLDDDGPGDQGFMARWRQSRIREMQSGPRDSKMHLNGRSRNTYGGMTAVDGEGYLDAVDNSGPDTVVVVYIYDEYSHVSELFEACLRTLASQHRTTRFVKLHFDDAQMEPAGVPAIIAYRGGDKFAALVPLVDELPDDADLSATTLETVMKRHQILH